MNDEMPTRSVPKIVKQLLLVAVGMFGFGFALVPLYDVFCDVTGLNGKTSGEAYEAVDVAVNTDRFVKIQFVATNNADMTWAFRPDKTVLRVNPGAVNATTFYAKNPAGFTMTAQAIPSIQPASAVDYFHKTECFCFSQQVLKAGEEVHMPLQFIVDQDLPKDIHTITLSYTLFDVTDKVASRD